MAETADILESAASFLKLGAKKLWLAYDEEVDVLYVSFRRPQKAPGSRMEGDLIYHHRDKELVGVTILHASEINQQEETGSEVTIPKEIQPQTLNMQRCISNLRRQAPGSRRYTPPTCPGNSTARHRGAPLHHQEDGSHTVADTNAKPPSAKDAVLDTAQHGLDLSRANIGIKQTQRQLTP